MTEIRRVDVAPVEIRRAPPSQAQQMEAPGPQDRVEIGAQRPADVAPLPSGTVQAQDGIAAEAPGDKALERELRQRLHRIESIGRSVGGDFKMQVKEGPMWAYDFTNNTITYRMEDLQGKPADYGIGVVLHEGSHRLYSRWLVEPEMSQQEPFLFLNNAVEDPRVNNITISRYQGAKDFFKVIYDEDLFKGRAEMQEQMAQKLAESSNGLVTLDQARRIVEKSGMQQPKHMQFGFGVIYDWYTDGQRDPSIKDPKVHDAMDRTQADYREAIRLKRDVLKTDLSTAEVDQQAQDAYQVIKERIWPVYKELLEQDVDDLSKAMQGQQGQSGQSGQSDQSGQSQGSTDTPKLTPQQARELAEKVLSELDKQVNDKLESRQEDLKRGGEGQQAGQDPKARQGQQADQGQSGNQADQGPQGNPQGGSPGSQGGGSEHGRSTSDIKVPDLEDLIRMKQEMEALYEGLKTDYDRYHGPVAPYADELAGELKNFLSENTRPKFQRETFASGRKLDMRSAMQAEARYERTGEFDPNIWLRRNNPTERGYEFVFVLDESGSMKGGNKWRNAVQALVMAAEALDQLDIGFGLVGFSDQPKVHKDLSEKFTLESRNSMLVDIETSPSGGTNDAEAVGSAIEMLSKGSPDKRKILVVITDGEGKETELKAQIARASQLGINTIGVGIDDGMAHVEEVYPEAVLVDKISKLPSKLAEVLREQIETESN